MTNHDDSLDTCVTIVLYGVPVLWNRYLLCSISLFAVGLQGQKRANGALCSRIFAPLNAEFEPRFCSRVQKHQLRASNGERSKNRVTFDPFFSVRRSPFAVQVTKSQPYSARSGGVTQNGLSDPRSNLVRFKKTVF